MSLCPYDPQLHFAALGSRYGVLSTGLHTVLSKSWTDFLLCSSAAVRDFVFQASMSWSIHHAMQVAYD
jgi:hypothetical protein